MTARKPKPTPPVVPTPTGDDGDTFTVPDAPTIAEHDAEAVADLGETEAPAVPELATDLEELVDPAGTLDDTVAELATNASKAGPLILELTCDGSQELGYFELPDGTAAAELEPFLAALGEPFTSCGRTVAESVPAELADAWGRRYARAVRDVLDLLARLAQEIQMFCVHDADASGTLIYQALQQGTTARRARRVKIVNLGLEPWEAVEMGLAVEEFTVKGGRKLPVAGYVREGGDERPAPPRRHEARTWEDWLQGRRVELNAMTSPAFIAWLDGKMEEHGAGKVVPPVAVLRERLRQDAEEALRESLMARLAAEHGLDGMVAEAMEARAGELSGDGLAALVAESLRREPGQRWDAPLRRRAAELAGGTPGGEAA
jgi:hypothetical protein